jgi:hemerythrin-like domain-containing protein
MNAIQLLKTDHETAKRMLGQIQSARAEQRKEMWKKLEPELKVHEQMEESSLYGPVAKELGAKDEKLRDWQGHHHKEVSQLEGVLKELDRLDPAEDTWIRKLGELRQTLEHHIQEEEGEIFPRIERAWDTSKLEQAGHQMETMKRQATGKAA